MATGSSLYLMASTSNHTLTAGSPGSRWRSANGSELRASGGRYRRTAGQRTHGRRVEHVGLKRLPWPGVVTVDGHGAELRIRRDHLDRVGVEGAVRAIGDAVVQMELTVRSGSLRAHLRPAQPVDEVMVVELECGREARLLPE